MLSGAAVSTETGGRKRGGTELTLIGVDVLALYRKIQSRTQSATSNELRALGTLARADVLQGKARNLRLTNEECRAKRPFICVFVAGMSQRVTTLRRRTV